MDLAISLLEMVLLGRGRDEVLNDDVAIGKYEDAALKNLLEDRFCETVMLLLFRLRRTGCVSDAALYVLLAFMLQYNTINMS
jgi:hypothetical protein